MAGSSAARPGQSIEDFLKPLTLDLPRICLLARKFAVTYRRLAAEADNQFLSTPITDTILKPLGQERGRYLAIDIGGTNLRAGFVELSGAGQATETEIHSKESTLNGQTPDPTKPRVIRTQKSWPIGEKLKQENALDLFAWIGECIVEVIEDALNMAPGSLGDEVPMGVTFSFPMLQDALNHAVLMSMGKGFAITSNLDLGKLLIEGYSKAVHARAGQQPTLPSIKIVAMVNDTVATLVSFMYQHEGSSNNKAKATMGLIVGTGTNATIPIKLSTLGPSKRPKLNDLATRSTLTEEFKIVVNTEWSISGAVGPLKDLDLITPWDQTLDSQSDAPGFQPFEYMTSGRYLGELGRLMILDYLTNCLDLPLSKLPPDLRYKNGVQTTFLGTLRPDTSFKQLEAEFPPEEGARHGSWKWTPAAATAVYQIGKAVERRAAAMIAAAIIGLLICAEEINLPDPSSISAPPSFKVSVTNERIEELVVGYTGGCIVHFQDYLADCQTYLDQIMEAEFRDQDPPGAYPRVVLQSSHDGGIIGAGVLAGMVMSLGGGT